VCHLFDGVVEVTSDHSSSPRCLRVDEYLHRDLATSQAMGLERSAMVDGNRPVVVESHEHARQHPGEAQAVWACGLQPTILAEDVVGVVVHVHL
jgi:hypothetical protein